MGCPPYLLKEIRDGFLHLLSGGFMIASADHIINIGIAGEGFLLRAAGLEEVVGGPDDDGAEDAAGLTDAKREDEANALDELSFTLLPEDSGVGPWLQSEDQSAKGC